MATAGKWKVYVKAKSNIGAGLVDFINDSFKCALFTSASNANTLTTPDVYSDLTNEVANGFGYTTGGFTLTCTWTNVGGIAFKFDSNDPFWDASGGSITARYAVIYDDTSSNILICVCAFSTDVTINSGEELRIIMDSSGVITLSGAITD